MALKENKKMIYLNTSKDHPGKLVIKRKGQPVQEYDSVEGKLVNILRKDGEYEGKPTIQYQFILQDGEEFYCVQLNGKSYLASSVFSRLPNCNLDKPIEIAAYPRGEGEKKTTSITVRQYGRNVDYVEGSVQPEKIDLDGEIILKWGNVIASHDEYIKQFNAKYGSGSQNTQEISEEEIAF